MNNVENSFINGKSWLMSMTQENNHVCPQCGKIYKWRHNMLRHINHECGKAPSFKCTLCEYCTKQKTHLKRHLVTVHKSVFQLEHLNV